ncbi:aldo/keto reductase [Dongia deserti]|uniref:aldo/keto reductase n=1 Tax=Dongia deserti TaxID=2268030 RepID=UPI000E6560FF|nr:aldo/keto reductase [Dongia deserti]
MSDDFRMRRLGRSGLVTGPLGVGTWAIGGPFFSGVGCRYPLGAPLGYGETDDRISIQTLRRAAELGITLFDTADAYGTGHGERIVGEALKDVRDRVLICTKFGNTYDEDRRELTGTNASPSYIREACYASLKRLQTDWIDLYQLHIGELPLDQAAIVADTLDDLCREGLVRYYGWSTDNPVCAAAFADRPAATAVQFDMNVFEDSPQIVEICESRGFAGIVRLPLAMGFLTGKYSPASHLPADDIRSRPPAWLRYFKEGGSTSREWHAALEAVKEILSSSGRTLAQGALAWIWARSACTIPIPGARTVAQIEENVGAMEFGPLTADQMSEIAALFRD